MKKLLAIGFSAALFLGACSDDTASDEKASTDKETEETTQQNTDVKQDMMKFYLSISKTINAVDADLNAYETAQAEETLPEGADLQTMKDAAKTSAEEAAKAVEGIEIPAELEEQQADIETSFASIKEAYEMKAEELTKDVPSFEAANAKFMEADEKLNALLEEQGLIPSSLLNEVSQ